MSSDYNVYFLNFNQKKDSSLHLFNYSMDIHSFGKLFAYQFSMLEKEKQEESKSEQNSYNYDIFIYFNDLSNGHS